MSAAAETRRQPRAPRPHRLGRSPSYGGFAPAIVLIGGFFFVPLGIVVAYSFWEDENYTVVHNWTTENYRYFFSVSAYVDTMWATLWVAAVGTAIAIGLAFPFAYWLSRYVPAAAARAAARARRGAVLDELPAARLLVDHDPRRQGPAQPVPASGRASRIGPVGVFLYDRPAVILVLVYLYFPFAALTLYSSIERFDWNQLRAAMDLGASPLTAIRRILPAPDPARAS